MDGLVGESVNGQESDVLVSETEKQRLFDRLIEA